MRKVFWQISATLDGYMEGRNRDLSDTAGMEDKDFDRYASDMLQSIGGMLLGRKTYEVFVDYWPKAKGADADAMNALPKFVVSKTLQRVEWNNSTLIDGDVAEKVAELKRQPGKDIAVFGSSNLASTLMQLGLIDEYRILVTPVILGNGTPTFKDTKKKIALKLLTATTMSTGIVALNYEPTWA
ncbi:MAG: dihydrofolate reductase family protein [Burkholderiaceae bacterium]